MQISEHFTSEDWNALKFHDETDWQTAISIFHDRVKSRFLNHIDAIKGSTWSGFAVMALDCLLIEMMQQFREGVDRSDSSGKSFKRFLTETEFRDYFDESLSDKFYTHIRCCILHQGEIKESSLITIREDAPLVKYSDDKHGLVVNRRLFHEKLVEVIAIYMKSLRDKSAEISRNNFRKKMDIISRNMPVEGKK